MSKKIVNNRILVVDDIYDNLLVIEAILEEEEYQIILEQDSQVALGMVEELLPELILLDVMMPNIDGYEFTRRIRKNSTLPFIPILLITAHTNETSVVKGLDAGADDFIRKPVDPDELLARVRSLLRLKHSIDERDHMASLREDFVSRFTHDLRTPLAASNRILKLLRSGRFSQVTPELVDIIDTMIGSNDDLLQMVNTLLEVYRHEAGYKKFDFADCNITELLGEVSQQLAPLAEEKGLKLSFESIAPIIIKGDRIELRRVLTNLIGNAIKFTASGSVDIRLQASSEKVKIEIEDTGAGISEQEQAVLFERFRQGKHQNSGSGLGLYLSRRIVAAHQGKIDLSSKLGFGSLFTITLPMDM